LSFDQIAQFCKLHPLEVKAIADGESAQGIKGLDPVITGQLSRDEIARGEADSEHKLKLSEPKVRVPESKRRTPRYTPLSKRQLRLSEPRVRAPASMGRPPLLTPLSTRQARPHAIRWLVKNPPELKGAQLPRLVGITKSTLEQIRNRTHWNSANLVPMFPLTL